MKIGLVLSNSPTYSETFFRSKIQGLKASGFEVTLFVQRSDSDFHLCKVVKAPKVYKHNLILQFFKMAFTLLGFAVRFPKRFFRFITLERQAQRSWFQIMKNIYNNLHLLRSDMDWLHFGFATIAIQSEHVAKTIKAKMAVSLRGFDIDVYPKEHPDCYDLLWEQVDKVHAISKYLIHKAYTLGLSSQKAMAIIPPAIDVAHFSSESYQFSEEKIRILTVARLHSIKDIDSVIQAMAILNEQHIDFEYIVIGEGLERENLEDQINALKLKDKVSLAGKKEHDAVSKAMNTADIYVQYSESEGFCNAVLEAQSMGLLCVVSDGGALPENVIHQKTGWVIPKKSPELLAQTIKTIIHLPNFNKEEISKAAQERVKKTFNLAHQRQQFKAFYEQE